MAEPEPPLDDERTEPELMRLYSPAEADALVPFLEETFRTVAEHRGRLHELVTELEAHGVDLGDAVPPEMLERADVSALVSRAMHEHASIKAELDKLGELAVEVKAIDGLCDVRSRHDGRIVYLCWRRGEPGFHHWHELDAGFTGRRRMMRKSDFEGTLLH